LLEAAVFLVSVKLIIMTYRNNQGVESIEKKLDLVLSGEEHLEKALAALRQSNLADSQKS
jgi:spore cortex formation protein SpoVR/YcgB (stage V sporulation)